MTSESQPSQFNGKIFSLPQLVETGFASRRQLYRMLASGDLKAFRVGSHFKIRGEEVEAYIERNTNHGADAA